jgi:hypothetical protein
MNCLVEGLRALARMGKALTIESQTTLTTLRVAFAFCRWTTAQRRVGEGRCVLIGERGRAVPERCMRQATEPDAASRGR